MSRNYDEEAFIYRIANMYYKDNVSQGDIAKVEGVSRSQVARMLDKARSNGMIKITVEIPERQNVKRLQESVKSVLGLNQVFVLPVDVTKYSVGDYFTAVKDAAELAAPIISDLLKERKHIGVGLGASIYYLSMAMKDNDESNVALEKQFIPLCNGFGESNSFFQPTIIANNFAIRCNGTALFVTLPNTPQSSGDWSAVDQLLYRQAKEYRSQLDAAIVGIGPGNPMDHEYFKESLEVNMPDAYELEIAPELSGDILGVKFTKEGDIRPNESRLCSCSIDLEDLGALPLTVAFAFGEKKISAIECAARRGLYNTLITDISTARGLLGL